ncbi:MAG: crotonase/enoyl-CoA hydratase family protein [Hyphomicrobiales bacterium]|nr:crotonase/enoyl-CoA hydratase family protein [Hyphomicrobiales bacterium]
MDEKLLFAQDGHVVTLTLNQPDLRNPVTDADFVDAFIARCEQIRADLSVRCVIITGAGKGFSSGGNLKHMRDRVGTFAGGAVDIADNYRTGIQRIPRTLWDLEVPVIAAVNGPAYGAGCDLTLMCDIRIASERAVFAENFVKVGIIPGDGGAWLLPRAIGLSRAAEMTLTGEPIDARTALEWGLVSRVVPHDDLMPAARDLAARIAVNPPRQLRLAKRLLREGQHTRIGPLLELSATYQAACHQTADHAEAVNALLEKRSPTFTGE